MLDTHAWAVCLRWGMDFVNCNSWLPRRLYAIEGNGKMGNGRLQAQKV